MGNAKEFDVLIFGGGPAGVSSAIWADELGLTSAIVDRGSSLGGQLFNVHNAIRNYPGAEFQNGSQMYEFLSRQIATRSTMLLLNKVVTSVNVRSRSLTFENGETVSGRSLIVATGVRRRILNVPGETEFLGKGILDSGARDPEAVSGKTVAIVGGGDSALENALILSTFAERVIIIHRRGEFSARPEFISRVVVRRSITPILDSEVTGFFGKEMLGTIIVRNKRTGESVSHQIDHALIRIGFVPNSELFNDQLKCDENGYISTVRGLMTSVPGCYAVGDIHLPTGQSISAAVGDGATAVNEIYSQLRQPD